MNSKIDNLTICGNYHKKIKNEVTTKLDAHFKNNTQMKYMELATFIESKITNYVGKNDLSGGYGFPVGISVNNIAAHDSAIFNDQRVFTKNDVVKIDFGIHLNGNIIDSAFTYCKDDNYDELLECTIEATKKGISMAGPDANILDITNSINEIITSYELNINNKTTQINPIEGLGGHNILPYKIHAGKIILCKNTYPKNMLNQRMADGEIYAIETFASTGSGKISQDHNIPFTHYMLKDGVGKINFSSNMTRETYNWIKKNRGTLPFAPRWIESENFKETKIKLGLNDLLKKGVILSYPALSDTTGTYISHSEHTISVSEKGTQILS